MRAGENNDDIASFQYDDIYAEDYVPLADVRKNTLRLLSYALVPILLLLISAGSCVKIARFASYPFVLKSTKQDYVHRIFDDVFVNQHYAEVGAEVSPETPLVRISSPRITYLSTRNSLASAKAEITASYGDVSVGNDGFIIKAEKGGTLSYLTDANKEIPAGTVVFKISETGSRLYASSAVHPDQLKSISVDSPVVLTLSAFPPYEWGTVRGLIKSLSPMPEGSGDFSLEVEITDAGRLHDRVKSGMTGELAITVEERTFFGYLFKRLKSSAPP